MNNLLSFLRLSSFTDVLRAYRSAGIDLGAVIDGGAGAGHTAKQMITALPAKTKCYAFEPFPGNHRFFDGIDPQIRLMPFALSDKNGKGKFQVPSVVSEDSEWGKRGMAGYSSVGSLTDQPKAGANVLEINCVRADSVIPKRTKVGFVKLDLQGGEFNALLGMTGLVDNIKVMWVEYSGQEGLLDLIESMGFLIFDTEYFFTGTPDDAAKLAFDVSKHDVTLSTGSPAWFGFKKTSWGNYNEEMAGYRKSLNLVQTDLICINRRHLLDFCDAMPYLARVKTPKLPPRRASLRQNAPAKPLIASAGDPPPLCPICALGQTELRATFLQSGKPVDVFYCSECTSFSSPFAPEMPLSTSINWHLSVQDRNSRFSRELLDSIGLAKPRVLDIGCGIGTLIRAAKEMGGDGVGFELNEACVAYGVQNGLDLRAELWGLDTKVPKPTLITCIMVLEHIHQPRALLKDLVQASRKYRAPLFVSVPWFNDYWWKYLDEPVVPGKFHPFSTPAVHVSHFSFTGFEKVCREFGAKELRLIRGGWTGFLIR